MSTIYIDNKSYNVKQGKNLLEACLGLGIDLPYFCWHPALGSVGACRQCAVMVFKDENDTHGKLMMSCMENIKDGLRVSVADKTAKAFRSQVIEWLMTNHPHDCPVCDEGGSCHLQDMTVMTGHDYRRYHFKKRTYTNQYLGPFIQHEMNRCIQCYRCVRYYHDYAGGKDLNVFAAHHHVYFGREQDGVLQSPFSGNLAEVCPTGVFTDKTLHEHYTRKWDLTTAPSVCHHCSVGCNTIAGERYGQVRCITNRFNSQVNGYFLCDRGRFGYEFINSENRITQPLIRSQAVEAVDEVTLMGHMRKLLAGHTLIGIGSPRASVESNTALMQLVGKENFYQGISDNVGFIQRRIVEVLQTGVVKTASLQDIQQADAILVLGEDIWNTAPVMALAVRQSVLKTAAHHALEHNASIPVWHDAAVHEIVQEGKGFLANCTITVSPLDEISTCVLHNAPDDLARVGFAIAHQLNGSLPRVLVDEDTLANVIDIAVFLQQAKRPVIISGTGCYNEALIRAAFDVAAACKTADNDVRIAYVMPECNSMGLAMMQASSFESAVLRTTREKNITAIVLENDLYRNMSTLVADLFFNSVEHCIVLDSLNTLTTQHADILMPAATFAEGDGTLVNYEGRAQRFFQVFMPGHTAIQESWKWLLKMQAAQTGVVNDGVLHPEDVLALTEQLLPQFAGIADAAPHHDFRINGQALPREPHRYSGRTAMLSNLAVSEPKPKQDDDSPFTFTMEGYSGMPPSPLIPFFWSPGWNSIQAVNKYQQEPGGPLKNEQAGKLLFAYAPDATAYFKDIPESYVVRNDRWLLFPQYHVLGSEELSAYTKGIRELSPEPYVALSARDAARLGLTNGQTVAIRVFEQAYELPVTIDRSLPNGLILIPAGLQSMPVMNWNSYVSLMLTI